MNDPLIVDLDVEETDSVAPWRAGSLTLVAAPLLVVAVLVALVVPRVGSRPAAEPAPTPAATRDVMMIFTAPPPTIPVVPTPVPGTPGESGDPEVLEDQRWAPFAPGYPGRGDVAEAVLDGRAYVIGGSGTSEDGRHVYRYDPRTGERERAADLPISIDHAMAATLGGRIYVFGGYVFGRPTERVFSLGSNDANWIEHSPMPAPRAAGGAAVLHGRIWLVGGLGADGSWIRDTWSWDGSGRWSWGFAPLPTPRDHVAVGAFNGRICAAGGNGGERAFECYAPVRNEWTVMPPLRKNAIGARAAEVAGWFWVIGQDVHVFTVDHWHFGPRPQTPRAGHALVTIDGALYVIEGALGFGPTHTEMFRPPL